MRIGFSVVAVFLACFIYAVECGGECVADPAGIVYCSKIKGGGAAAGPAGIVKCQGGCERGSRSMCERQ